MRLHRPLQAATLLAAALLTSAAPAQDEVPFITTPDHVTLAMLQLAHVGPRDHIIDLGSGDGRIVITAARRFGASGLGVEIVPDLVQRSRSTAAKAGVAARAEFLEQDLFKTDLSSATVVTMYLLPEVNLQLRPALLALKPGTRIVSHDWDLGDWAPDETRTLDVPDKPVGREKLSRLHLWVVPASVQGLWCGPRGGSLQLQQTYQRVQGSLSAAGTAVSLSGTLSGQDLRVLASEGRALTLQHTPAGLQVTAAGAWTAWRGAAFSRAAGARCG
ncbi:MAG TPA: class I SAM-dependent methyltransferase [Rubrivivax sp.]